MPASISLMPLPVLDEADRIVEDSSYTCRHAGDETPNGVTPCNHPKKICPYEGALKSLGVILRHQGDGGGSCWAEGSLEDYHITLQLEIQRKEEEKAREKKFYSSGRAPNICVFGGESICGVVSCMNDRCHYENLDSGAKGFTGVLRYQGKNGVATCLRQARVGGLEVKTPVNVFSVGKTKEKGADISELGIESRRNSIRGMRDVRREVLSVFYNLQ